MENSDGRQGAQTSIQKVPDFPLRWVVLATTLTVVNSKAHLLCPRHHSKQRVFNPHGNPRRQVLSS